MRKLEGRVALVTGSGKNIGRAIALALAELGASVAVHGRTDRKAVEAVAREVEAHGVRALPVMGDVADPEQVQRMVAEVHTGLGQVDILVSNAAIRPHAPFLEMTAEQWRQVMAVNLDACFYLCKATIPDMVAKRRGSIIALSGSSALGVHADRAHVSTSKAGLIALMKALAREFAPHNIRANSIVPGSVDTVRQHPEWYPGRPAPERRAADIPMGRQARPEEIAATCAFLVSDDASYVTGQSIVMAGAQFM